MLGFGEMPGHVAAVWRIPDVDTGISEPQAQFSELLPVSSLSISRARGCLSRLGTGFTALWSTGGLLALPGCQVFRGDEVGS